jgi:hypothetical protein
MKGILAAIVSLDMVVATLSVCLPICHPTQLGCSIGTVLTLVNGGLAALHETGCRYAIAAITVSVGAFSLIAIIWPLAPQDSLVHTYQGSH